MTSAGLKGVAAAGLLLTVVSSGLPAQTVRVSGSTSMRYIELRELAHDSLPQADVTGSGLLRQQPDGRIVRCIPGDTYCYDVRPGDVVSTVPVIHDINVNVWGLGRGIRLNAQLRGRSSFGSETDLWPRESDHLEVLSLYGEMERGSLRLRAGRQWRVSGLGFYNFDGLAVALRPQTSLLLEAYGGRSLSRGLNAPRTGGALESIEDLSLPNAGLLFGLQARYRPSLRVQAGAVYQLDIRGDRKGAYSELLATDGMVRLGRATAEASMEFDLAGRALNHARLTYRTPPRGNFSAFAEARRYHPYFELWTIWGAFSPVGFDQGSGGVTWARPDGSLMVRGELSYRSYEDAATDAVDDFRTTGWGVGGTMTWQATPAWQVSGGYRLESGFGAAGWDGQAALRRDLSQTTFVTVQAVGFQRLYEFRLGEGTVYGLGGQGAMQVGDRGRVFGSLMWYRQHGGLPTEMDWNQRRASLRFEWALGSEPAYVPTGRPIR